MGGSERHKIGIHDHHHRPCPTRGGRCFDVPCDPLSYAVVKSEIWKPCLFAPFKDPWILVSGWLWVWILTPWKTSSASGSFHHPIVCPAMPLRKSLELRERPRRPNNHRGELAPLWPPGNLQSFQVSKKLKSKSGCFKHWILVPKKNETTVRPLFIGQISVDTSRAYVAWHELLQKMIVFPTPGTPTPTTTATCTPTPTPPSPPQPRKKNYTLSVFNCLFSSICMLLPIHQPAQFASLPCTTYSDARQRYKICAKPNLPRTGHPKQPLGWSLVIHKNARKHTGSTPSLVCCQTKYLRKLLVYHPFSHLWSWQAQPGTLSAR